MYVINDNCIACGACSGACPSDAIAMDDNLGHFAINTDTCVECGSCVDTCPMGCIEEN